jgi:ABC-type sugar transport system ATPase subunit
MTAIALRNVVKNYPGFELGPLNLEVEQGEFFGIFGPPSSGKTSVLKLMLGLINPDAGEVFLGGTDAAGRDVADRGISMVFQNLALFPHMTGRENIIFPLVERGAKQEEISRRLDFVSEVLHVSHILHKNPAQMSGGERQRIALGRAFAAESRAMLLDEPIAALDARLREEMRVELKRLQRENNQTFVYVSHDEEEVMAISDRIAIMIGGRVLQIGSPDEVYSRPNSIRVAEVIGTPPMNFFEGILTRSGTQFVSDLIPDPLDISVSGGRDGAVTLGVRPEDLWLNLTGAGHLRLKVSSTEPLGGSTIVNALAGEKMVKLRAAGQVELRPGEEIAVSIDLRKLHLFDGAGARL